MWTDVWIVIFVLAYHSAVSQFIETQLCLTKCLCLTDDRIISCDKSNNLEGLPTNIESSFHRLMIQNGNFRDPVIFRRNLTGLSHLTYLKVIYSGITAVEPRAFENMTQLKYLDLSHNNIRVIQPFTFIGLNLGEMHLMENHGMLLLPDSFKGMTVDSMNLRSNDLKSLDFETFEGIKLQKLYLYNNRISVIDPKFATIFNNPEMLIDLTGNPLHCSCEVRWLVEFLKLKIKDSKYETLMKTVNFTCVLPLSLAGKEMIRLPAQDFQCDSPKIQSISVIFGMPITQLTCIAEGSSYRSPGVAWNYVEADNVRELRRNPLVMQIKSEKKFHASISVNVTTTEDTLNAFTCVTWLEETQKEKIVIHIKSPPKSIITTPSNKFPQRDNHPPLPVSYFLFQKQFTILEMVAAIVGTFIISLILLLMLARIVRWWKRSQKRELTYKTVNVNKPYWTLGHDSNPYFQPFCHTEYDIPKMYESRRSSICQSPPMDQFEYQDYKTINKVYST